MNKIEEVKKQIKEKICHNCKMRDMAVCESCQIDFEKATSQICQLFEPKPDESRLLKVQEEFLNTPNRNVNHCQLKQTAPLP